MSSGWTECADLKAAKSKAELFRCTPDPQFMARILDNLLES